MKLTIKTRLFIWFIIVSVIPLVLIGGFSYYLIFNKISLQTEETITNINMGIYNMVDTQQEVLSRWMESAAFSFSDKLDSLGDSVFDYTQMEDLSEHRLPAWYMGSQKITNDFTLVDDLIENEKLPATIFQLYDNKFIRVSTNVRQADGSRIVATAIDSGPVYDKIINGQQYLGRADVEGIMHATVYQPIWDQEGKLIGAFVLGRREQEYEMIAAIKDIVVGETGYAFIIDSQGNAIIHPTLQGQNLLQHEWVQEILKTKEGSITYDYEGLKKIAYYTYYPSWDWYIITSGYHSEIFNTTRELQRILLLAVLGAISISMLIAYFLSRVYSKPINEMVGVMRETQNGDLSVRLNYVHDDEFKVVSHAYNAMLHTFSLMIGRILHNSSNLKEASKRLMVDIQQSMQSLKGIENGIAALNSQIQQEIVQQSLLHDSKMKEELLHQIYQIGVQTQQVMDNPDIALISQINSQLAKLESFIINYSAHDLTPSRPTRINNLEVEIEKLKLLFAHIDSSASSLDDIALALDQHVKIFKVDHSQ